VNHLLDWFGPHRLMWGSDWPVVNLAGGFARWREATLALLPKTARAAILGQTAVRFYGLQPPIGAEAEAAT
jgi:L-fuconolactonase